MCKNDVHTLIKMYFMLRNANHHLSLRENGADKLVQHRVATNLQSNLVKKQNKTPQYLWYAMKQNEKRKKQGMLVFVIKFFLEP